MDIRRTSEPLTREQKLEVVPLDLVKMQARIRHSDEDRLLIGYVCAAFDYLHGPEGWLNGYCLLEEEFEFYPGRFDTTIELPLRPFLDDTAEIAERATSAADYADLATTDYLLTSMSDFGVLARLTPPARFPVRSDARITRVRFKAGWTDPANVPEPIKQSIMLLAAHFYNNREATMSDTGTRMISREVEYGLKSLAGRYRVSPDHS